MTETTGKLVRSRRAGFGRSARGLGRTVGLAALLFLVGVTLGLPTVAAASAEDDEVCLDTTSIEVGETVQERRLGAGRTECFDLELAGPGTLLLEANVGPRSSAEPKLGFLGPACVRPGDAALEMKVDQALNRATVAIPQAGRYAFCVAAREAREILKDVRVSSRFVSDDAVPDLDLALDESTLTDKDDGEADPVVVNVPPPDANILQERPTGPLPMDVLLRAPGLLVIDGSVLRTQPGWQWASLPAAGVELVDRLATPVLPARERLWIPAESAALDLRFRFYDICATDGDESGGDDHSGLSFCASALDLDTETSAELDGLWEDDEDLFSFVVTEHRMLRIETLGRTDTFGRLYDAQGHRLAEDDDGGRGGNFLIATTLAPGRYFVRVAGPPGETGTYRIVIEDLVW